MSADSPGRDGPHYDAFVVRLWRGEVRDHLLRAEVEHARTGVRMRAVGVPTAWVLVQITAHLGASPSCGAATTDDRPTAAAIPDGDPAAGRAKRTTGGALWTEPTSTL